MGSPIPPDEEPGHGIASAGLPPVREGAGPAAEATAADAAPVVMDGSLMYPWCRQAIAPARPPATAAPRRSGRDSPAHAAGRENRPYRRAGAVPLGARRDGYCPGLAGPPLALFRGKPVIRPGRIPLTP